MEESNIVCIITIIVFICVSVWFVYVFCSAYPIILDGIKIIYRIYVAHSVLLMTNAIITLLLQDCVLQDEILSEYTLIITIAILWRPLVMLQSFLATLIAYHKTKFYHILISMEGRAHSPFLLILSKCMLTLWGVLICPCSIILSILTVNPHLSEEGRMTWYDTNMLWRIGSAICVMCFTILHIVAYINIWKLQDANSIIIPQINEQIRSNLYFIPLIHLTSFCIIIGFVLILNIVPHHHFDVLSKTLKLVDDFLNNIFCFYLLYHNDAWTSGPILKFQMSHDWHWCLIPGFFPIRITEDVMKENDLWKYKITNRAVLVQIKRYRHRGFTSVPSLYWNFCSSMGEVDDQLQQQASNLDIHFYE